MTKHNDDIDILIKFLPQGSVKIDEILSFFNIHKLNDITIERIEMFGEKDGELIDPFNY